jgi:hypothetical protein
MLKNIDNLNRLHVIYFKAYIPTGEQVEIFSHCPLKPHSILEFPLILYPGQQFTMIVSPKVVLLFEIMTSAYGTVGYPQSIKHLFLINIQI